MILICGSPEDWRHYAGTNITNNAVAMQSVTVDTNYSCAALCGKREGCTVATVEGTNLCKLFDICPAGVVLQPSPNVQTYVRHFKEWTRPPGFTGTNPVFYLPFDHPSCITQHGTTLTTGRVGTGIIASADRSWASLGRFPGRCFTQPLSCSQGLSVSFWFRVDDASNIGGYGGLLSTRSYDGGDNQAFSIWSQAPSGSGMGLYYQILYGSSKHCNVYSIPLPTTGWVHSVFTWKDGQDLLVYHNGVQVLNIFYFLCHSTRALTYNYFLLMLFV